MPPMIDPDRCTGCGICYDICPGDVIRLNAGKAVVRYADECWHCGACRLECPEDAVRFYFPIRMVKI